MDQLEKKIKYREKDCIKDYKKHFIENGKFGINHWSCVGQLNANRKVHLDDINVLTKRYPHVDFSITHCHEYPGKNLKLQFVTREKQLNDLF